MMVTDKEWRERIKNTRNPIMKNLPEPCRTLDKKRVLAKLEAMNKKGWLDEEGKYDFAEHSFPEKGEHP